MVRTTGAAGAVKVGLVFLRRVELNHETNVVYVDSAGSYVGSNQHANVAASESLEVTVSLVLVEVTV